MRDIFQNLYYSLDSEVLLIVGSLCCVAILLIVSVLWIRRAVNKQIISNEKRIKQIESEFDVIRQRSNASFDMFKKVVSGFDDIVHHMKIAIEEEEQKAKIIDAAEQKDLLEKR